MAGTVCITCRCRGVASTHNSTCVVLVVGVQGFLVTRSVLWAGLVRTQSLCELWLAYTLAGVPEAQVLADSPWFAGSVLIAQGCRLNDHCAMIRDTYLSLLIGSQFQQLHKHQDAVAAAPGSSGLASSPQVPAVVCTHPRVAQGPFIQASWPKCGSALNAFCMPSSDPPLPQGWPCPCLPVFPHTAVPNKVWQQILGTGCLIRAGASGCCFRACVWQHW